MKSRTGRSIRTDGAYLTLCAQLGAFNLHAARRVAPNDKQGKDMLCRYILRPSLANERLHLLADGSVTVEFKRPWSDGTRSIGLAPSALISRMAALVPPPKRHVTVYSGVLASNSPWRRLIIPKTEAAATESPLLENAEEGGLPAKPVPGPAGVAGKPKSGGRRYIPWYELLRRTFGEEVVCPDCGGRLRLIALVKKEETIQALLKALHLPTQATGPPERAKPEPATTEPLELEWSGEGESADWPEYPD